MATGNTTVREMRSLAKQRGLNRYSKLTKAQLIQLLAERPILDDPVPYIDVTPLTPQPTGFVQHAKEFVITTANYIANLLSPYVPPKPKVIDRFINYFKNQIIQLYNKPNANNNKGSFELNETKSALKGVTKQFTINEVDGCDAQTFMNAVKSQVVNLLKENRLNKFKFVLTCVMEKVDMKTGNVERADFPFLSKSEVVLEATDVDELYDHARDKNFGDNRNLSAERKQLAICFSC